MQVINLAGCTNLKTHLMILQILALSVILIFENNVAFWGVGYIVVIRVVHGFIHFPVVCFVHCCTSFTAFHEVFMNRFKTS